MSRHQVWVDALERRCLLSVSFNSNLAGGVAVLTPDDSRVADQVALQADGKIVVAGHSTPSANDGALLVRRYNTDGSIDKSFNGGKPVSVDLTPQIDTAAAMQIDGKGRIVILVQSRMPVSAYDYTSTHAMVRLTPSGALDREFSVDGIVHPVPDFMYAPLFVTFADGRINLLGGDNFTDLRQYTSAGQIDRSFDGDGRKLLDADRVMGAGADGDALVILSQNYADDTSTHQVIHVDANGEERRTPRQPNTIDSFQNAIFVNGRFYTRGRDQTYSIKLNGKVDSTFGVNGAVYAPDVIAARPDGGVVAALRSASDYDDDYYNSHPIPGGVWAYTSKGKRDKTFAGDGSTEFILPNTTFPLAGVVVQNDGKIVLAGTTDEPSDFSLMRFNTNGTLDKTFSSDGVVRDAIPGANGTNRFVIMQPDSRFIVSGTVQQVDDNQPHASVERYTLNGLLDTSFSLDKKLRDASALQVTLLLTDGSMIGTGTFGGKPIVFRLTASGKLDKRLGGKGYVNAATNNIALARDGRFFVESDGAVRRYRADGTLDTKYGRNGVAKLKTPGYKDYDDHFAKVVELDVQSDGGVIISTATRDQFSPVTALTRLTSSGSVDKTFGASGYEPEGEVHVNAGNEHHHLTTVIGINEEVYNISADIDGYQTLSEFDRHGKVSSDMYGYGESDRYGFFASQLVVLPDGRLLRPGSRYIFSEDDRQVLDYEVPNVDGTYFTVVRGGGFDSYGRTWAASGAIAPNGDLILVGGGIGSLDYDPVPTLARRLIVRVRGISVPGTVEQDDNRLAIIGTSKSDTLTAKVSGGKLRITLNGTLHTFNAKAITSIQAELGDGDDTVDFGTITMDSTLWGQGGNDTLIGGAGRDELNGGAGSDVLRGAAGNDVVSYADRADNLKLSLDGKANDGAPGENDLIGNDVETLVGSSGDDLIIGSNRGDVLHGGPDVVGYRALIAHDTIRGMGGNDLLLGYQIDPGTGNDTLGGDSESAPFGWVNFIKADYSRRTESMVADLINGRVTFASGEVDTLLTKPTLFHAGSGNDKITGDGQSDFAEQSIYGGEGDDTLKGSTFSLRTELWGESGNDLLLNGGTMVGGLGIDTLQSTADYNFGMISFEDRTSAVVIDLFHRATSDGDILLGKLTGAIGGTGNDTLIGASGNEILQGGPGDDSINGSGGFDELYGEAGNDSLQGGRGDDQLYGGAGADQLRGGEGFDTANYSDRTENLSLSLDNLANDGAPSEGDNIMADVERVEGGHGRDRIVGNRADNVLIGGDYESPGFDTLFGGKGNDTLYATGGNSALYGQEGDDQLFANRGTKDTIDGGAGTDTTRSEDSDSVKDMVLSIETFV